MAWQDAFQRVLLAQEIESECFVPIWSLLVVYVWDAACGVLGLHTAQQAAAGQLHLPRTCSDMPHLMGALAVQRGKALATMLCGFVLAVKWVDGQWLSYRAHEDAGLVPCKRFQLHP